MPDPRILITSAGRRVQLVRGFQQVVKRITPNGAIFTCDASDTAPASHIAEMNLEISRVDSGSYISELLSLCEQHRINLIIPTIDTELALLSKAREDFLARGVNVIVSDPATIEIASSKRATHEWLNEQGIPIPRQWTLGEITKVIRSSEEVRFPLIAKPNRGSMSKGVRMVADRDELGRLVDEIGNADYVIESLAMGREFTVSTYVDRFGKCLAAIPRLRMEVRAGEVSKGMTLESELLQLTAARIVESLPGARGPLNVQMFLDTHDNACNVIEINARFGGGDPLAWMAGADAPHWIVSEFQGLPVEPLMHWQSGLMMLRYDDAVFLQSKDFR